MSIHGHNSDPIPANGEIMRVNYITMYISPMFLKNILFYYTIWHVFIFMLVTEDYILGHRACRGNIYYCRELDTKKGYHWVTPGKEGVFTWKTPPIHTKLVIKQGVSPSKRLIH